MGEQTAIAWTDHTFNPWWGCERVSPGCQHCYAETKFAPRLNALTGHVIGPDDVLPHHVDWVIVGGESGPGHRPLDLDAARTIRDHCSGKVCDPWGVNNRLPVPFFFKQVGGRTPTAGGDLLDGERIKQFPREAMR